MARLAFSHPSRKRLHAWLDGADLASVGDHVDHCERCAARLEELSEVADSSAPDDALSTALREVFVAPDGIDTRVIQGIEARARADRELALLFGLFGIATDAAALLLPDDATGDDEGREDRS